MKEKEYTYLIIRIMDASLKTLQGKPTGTKPCEEKRVYHVLTPPHENIKRLGSSLSNLEHHLL